ncbi:aldehyde ferredoxin oxidoreductase family protein [Thermanaeromonas sp. C210]|uniref:aldehyde ferredoxin oxidoreductase family protein n=1 Tax=Thermanaeromonas sp. C210 TaxID=2731925 RepID=UPI00155D597B|nr:aldehyde ferredoxin oxidoreductase family protein [Thermanaeromonas sp. C210]GFN23918.1 aldehyde ferredoxin oxidoreductase [Thermanaeromonas sp. C210]
MFKYRGYTGNILRVDLNRQKIDKIPLAESLAEKYLGGNGFGIRFLWDEVPPEADPLSPVNLLIFATGPLVGTLIPNSGRIEAIAKSPLTNMYGDSNAGGFFGPELKFAGYDMLVFRGRAPQPVYLYIEDELVELRDATHLWGKDTIETEEILRDELKDPDVKVACIGPAGENMVRYACIQVTPQRSLGRSGMGAVMGSKNLKAVAVRGTKGIAIAEPDKFHDLALEFHRRLRANDVYPAVSKYGTPGIVSIMNMIGRFPTKNFQYGAYEWADDINAESLHKKHFVKHLACYACPVACDKLFKIKEGEYRGLACRSVEYETLNGFGANILNRDLASILKANDMADRLGLDVISASRAISFAMELWEKGILSHGEVEGMDLSWGNMETVFKLLNMIAYRQGFGDLLAEGVKRAAEKIGRGAEYYAMHVKGQEIAAQDGRAQQSMGLAHVTSNRGADHLKGFPTIDETGYPAEAERRYGKEYLPDMADPRSIKHKGFLVKDGEDFAAVVDSAGNCKSGGTFVLAEIYWEDMARAIRYATGLEIEVQGLKKIGERIYNLQRCYNVLCGISRKDDTLPRRFLEEPNPSAAAKGLVCRLEPMLEEYYYLRNWDPRTGYPTIKKLEELDLKDAVDRIGREKLIYSREDMKPDRSE